MASYEIWLDDPRGNRLVMLDNVSGLSATRIANSGGAISINLPSLYDRYIMVDGIIEVWRRPTGGKIKLFNAYMYRRWSFDDMGGTDYTVINGKDGLSIAARRIVAYAAGSAYSAKTTYADDMIKAIAREACTTAATDTDRDWSGYGFDVDGDLSAAPSISLAFAYQQITEVFIKASEAARANGTRLYYDVIPTYQTDGTLGWRVVTNVNQPGQDLRDTVTFGREFGNLTDARLEFDYSEESTVVYSLGQGLETNRVVEEVEDTTRSSKSVWARIEESYNAAGQASTTADVYAAGQARLSERRPRLRLTGTLVDTPAAPFGVAWDYGDLVSITHRGYQFDAVVNTVKLDLASNGDDIITAGFEVIDE